MHLNIYKHLKRYGLFFSYKICGYFIKNIGNFIQFFLLECIGQIASEATTYRKILIQMK